jgi:aromatase
MPASAVHRTTVSAPAEEVYALIADVTWWPSVFPPTIHAETTALTGHEEQIRLWATAGGGVRHWTSHRCLDPARLRVEFRQEVSPHPVAAMSGAWVVGSAGPDLSLVTLEHTWRAVDDDPDDLAWIESAVDVNSRAELAALKATAEARRADLALSFTDSLDVAGDVADLYDFINEADRWAERIPHVAHVELTEPAPGVQFLDMDTRTADGSIHATESYRICFSPHRIVYKQVKVPALMTAHTGSWGFASAPGGGATITSTHTFVLNPAAIPGVLGPGATVATARDFVHDALSRNSTTTMRHARDYAEGIRHGSASRGAVRAEH